MEFTAWETVDAELVPDGFNNKNTSNFFTEN